MTKASAKGKPNKAPKSGDTSAKTQSDPSEQSAVKLLVWIWRKFLHRHHKPLVVALILMVIEGSTSAMFALMMEPLFDDVFVAKDKSSLSWIIFAIMGIFLLRAVTSIAQKTLLTRISERSMGEIRSALLDKVMRLDLDFHLKSGPGTLLQRVDGDVSAIGKVWSTVITGAGRDLIMLVTLTATAIYMDWLLTLLAVICMPLLIFPISLIQRFVRGKARESRLLSARLSTRLNEIFHGITAVKLNSLERYQGRQYADLTSRRVDLQTRASLGQAMLPGMVDIMSGLGFVAIALYGGNKIASGDLSLGDFMVFFFAIGQMFEPLRRLGAMSGVAQVAAASIERIQELLLAIPRIDDPVDPLPAPQGIPDVVFHDVNLTFGETQVLHDLQFVAESGKTTALVGASGAGKSTVFNLITRLLDPQTGAVEISGIPTNMMRQSDLRDLISVVSQDAALFDETLRENILLGRKDVSKDELQSTLEAAFVTDFLGRLENGLDSAVGPRGANLSGGQRQRVAIARALLRNTPILLLDEATSALDVQSERMVQEALEKLAVGRTTLVIAHRLSTVRSADKIVVMDHGRVVEQGTNDELLAKNGAYARLHALQFD